MKKLIIAAAIVCAAVVSHGAASSWRSGVSIKPDGATTAAAGTLSIYVFLVDSTTYADTAIGDIWGSYGKDKVSDLTKSATYSAVSTMAGTVAAAQPAGDVGKSTTYYGIVITAYDKNSDGTIDMYASNKASFATNGSGTQLNMNSNNNLAKYIGGGTSGDPVTWTAVPEPTSGLLLLLGVAGLALKRKRA